MVPALDGEADVPIVLALSLLPGDLQIDRDRHFE